MGTRFSVRPGGAAAAGESDPTVEFAPGGAQARLPGPPAQPWATVAPLPPRVRVEILHDTDRGAEAHAIAAAVQAASEVQGRPVALEDRALSDPIGALPPADWYFWLSARDVPGELSAGMANVWSESAASRVATSGITADRVVALNGAPGADAIGSSAPRLRRRSAPSIANTSVGTAVLWTDGHGAPLLTLNRTGGQHFAFFSRFDPDWSDFRGGTLPAAVSDLLFPSALPMPIDSARDVRLADPSQYVVSLANPRTGFTFPPVLPGAANATDLHWLLWLLAASLFAAERFLSRPTFAAAVPIPAQRTAAFVP